MEQLAHARALQAEVVQGEYHFCAALRRLSEATHGQIHEVLKVNNFRTNILKHGCEGLFYSRVGVGLFVAFEKEVVGDLVHLNPLVDAPKDRVIRPTHILFRTGDLHLVAQGP